jgi:hypothetical protein
MTKVALAERPKKKRPQVGWRVRFIAGRKKP